MPPGIVNLAPIRAPTGERLGIFWESLFARLLRGPIYPGDDRILEHRDDEILSWIVSRFLSVVSISSTFLLIVPEIRGGRWSVGFVFFERALVIWVRLATGFGGG